MKETVAAPAAWIERALRDPAQHKRTVDVYRFAKSGSTTTLGKPAVRQCRAAGGGRQGAVGYLPRELPHPRAGQRQRPDHDPLTVVAVGGGPKSVVSIGSDGVLTYSVTPRPGHAPVCEASGGGDSFTYTIKDSFGATATATVRILPPAVVPPPTATVPGGARR